MYIVYLSVVCGHAIRSVSPLPIHVLHGKLESGVIIRKDRSLYCSQPPY